VTPAIGLDGTDQLLDLGAGQVLYSAFRFRLGVVTVRFTVAGATNFKGDFVMVFSPPAMPTVHISCILRTVQTSTISPIRSSF